MISGKLSVIRFCDKLQNLPQTPENFAQLRLQLVTLKCNEGRCQLLLLPLANCINSFAAALK